MQSVQSLEVEKKSCKKMAASAGDMGAMHAILTFLVLAFVPFLQLKYYNKHDASPFDDNSTLIFAFFIVTLTYVAAMVTNIKLRIDDKDCPNIIISISLLFAPLASILLVTIIFPYLGWSLLVIWCGFFAKLALVEMVHKVARYASSIKLLRREANKDDQVNDDQSSVVTNNSVDSIV
ncbi:hypothetical protein Gotri_027930 [Gossypium trilobum]|uniref:Uncharacterized protein n=4 Tax=Gossypium TaxID=3633 RepID=A0A7J9FU27_9ROSI|nr:hypothetical protein [Gossypium trilobum]